MKIVIVGCGLAGIACAIESRRRGLEVIILEKAAAISSVGAGIQIPPNAARTLKHLHLLDSLLEHVVTLENLDLRRYEDGKVLFRRACGKMDDEYGGPWCVIHREDYLRVLLDEAIRLGAELKLGACVKSIDFANTRVELENSEILEADVIVGADGIWSTMRDQILQKASPPTETGSLAYRATLNTDALREFQDDKINRLIEQKTVTLWMGPDKHCVVYPIKHGREWNMVLLRPDNLPTNIRTAVGDIDEMRETFKDWDTTLTKLISRIPTVLKWKMLFHDELEAWCRDSVVIIGDACHPTLPYQAQGAAMAVEDGAVLGLLLGRLSKEFSPEEAKCKIPAVLRFFESLRKQRTTLNVKGATKNGIMYHMHDGEEQKQRDKELMMFDGVSPSHWQWLDPEYQNQLLGFDVVKDADQKCDIWLRETNQKQSL